MMKFGQLLLAVAVALPGGDAFQPGPLPLPLPRRHLSMPTSNVATKRPRTVARSRDVLKLRSEEEWTGEVVSNDDAGRIKGCTITPVSETEFSITIDGEEADLGNFGNVVYRKITSDAKRQNYQGFRPGTLPPHLLPTYRAFAMDEVAREATLEAMQQNDIRPFDSARVDMLIEQVSIPPKRKKSKKKKKKKKKGALAEPQVQDAEDDAPEPWQTFDTMKEALKAGWEPGQSFSFVAKNCKGQKVQRVETERPPVI